MPDDNDSVHQTEIALQRQTEEEDAERMRRLKLVTEIQRKNPFPIEAVREWAEAVLIAIVAVFWLLCFIMLAIWFVGVNA